MRPQPILGRKASAQIYLGRKAPQPTYLGRKAVISHRRRHTPRF
jgi:hypothetical protein